MRNCSVLSQLLNRSLSLPLFQNFTAQRQGSALPDDRILVASSLLYPTKLPKIFGKQGPDHNLLIANTRFSILKTPHSLLLTSLPPVQTSREDRISLKG